MGWSELGDEHIFDAMEKHGGDFVRLLGALFRHADVDFENYHKLRNAFAEYWDKYRELARPAAEAEYGQKVRLAILVTDQTEAEIYLAYLVDIDRAAARKNGEPCSTGESLARVRSNLGYIAGYYDNETRERVERLYSCEHCVFGKIVEHGFPTPGEAAAAGDAA